MRTESSPNSDYTRTWSPSGEIEYAKPADGTRLRYLKPGSGPTALILLHTVRTQLDHFQLVIPKILHAFTAYDYSAGVGRANRVASIYVGGTRLPAIGSVVTRIENKPVLGIVMRG